MTITAPRPSHDVDEAAPPQDLFPEARARRRRIRLSSAAIAIVAAAGLVVGIGHRSIFGGRSLSGSALQRAQALPAPGRISSLTWTHTYYEGSRPGARDVVDTTFGSTPITQYWSYGSGANPGPLELQNMVVGNSVIFPARNPWQSPTPPPAKNANRVCWTTSNLGGPRILLRPSRSHKSLESLRNYRQKTTCTVTTKEWVQLPSKYTTTETYLPLPNMKRTLHALDPSYLLGELRRSAGPLKRTGTANIGGVHTTRYQGYLLPQYFYGIDAPQKAPLAEQMILGAAQGSDWDYNRFMQRQVPFAVWVDKRGVVRQVAVYSISKPVGHDTFTYSDFNRPVHLEPPANTTVFNVPPNGFAVTSNGNGL